MGVRIRIHPLLQDLAHGQEVVEVEGKNVGECLADLEKKFPGMEELIFEKKGKLLKQVEIFINGQIFKNRVTNSINSQIFNLPIGNKFTF